MYEIPEDGIDVPKRIGVVEDCGCVCHTWSNTRAVRLIIKLGKWEGKNEQTLFDHEVCAHSMTHFVQFAVLNSSG